MKSRRSFLRVMGAAPLVAKGVAEEAAKSLAGIGLSSGTMLQGNPMAQAGIPVGADYRYPSAANISQMLLDKAFRELVEEAAYQNNRHVSYIDHDLASKRSFSLAAKVTFQRQRNVAREIDGYAREHVSPWHLFVKRLNPFS